MRRLMVIIALGITISLLGRMFYLKEIAKVPMTADMLWLALITAVACLITIGLSNSLPGKARQARPSRRRAPAKPTTRRSKFDRPLATTPAQHPQSDASDLDAIMAELEASTGEADRAAALPGWAILLKDPFTTSHEATSWLGGTPYAPAGFRWPRNAEEKPLHFVGQIDLSAIAAEPTTGQRPPGLPRQGALLIFIGGQYPLRYQVRLISGSDMVGARPVTVPDDLPDIREIGFFLNKNTFHRWPIDLVPYLDDGSARPSHLPVPPMAPEAWITTWGLAAFEVKNAIKAVEDDAQRSVAHHIPFAQRRGGKEPKPVAERLEDHRLMMESLRPELLQALRAFEALADSNNADGPVDPVALKEIWEQRDAVTAQLDRFAVKMALLPNPVAIYSALRRAYFDCDTGAGLDETPIAYRAFLGSWINSWQGHRLFGRALPPVTDYPDLRGKDCLISILQDPLLATESEHENGFSIWCERATMLDGNFALGSYVPHTNV